MSEPMLEKVMEVSEPLPRNKTSKAKVARNKRIRDEIHDAMATLQEGQSFKLYNMTMDEARSMVGNYSKRYNFETEAAVRNMGDYIQVWITKQDKFCD